MEYLYVGTGSQQCSMLVSVCTSLGSQQPAKVASAISWFSCTVSAQGASSPGTQGTPVGDSCKSWPHAVPGTAWDVPLSPGSTRHFAASVPKQYGVNAMALASQHSRKPSSGHLHQRDLPVLSPSVPSLTVRAVGIARAGLPPPHCALLPSLSSQSWGAD